MFRHLFEEKLRNLQDEVLVLGSYADETLVEAIKVLQERDSSKGSYIIANHRNIKRKYAAIEVDILALLVTQQPMAGDLRLLTALLQTALELEHIAAHAREIAEVSLKLIREPLYYAYGDVFLMAKGAGSMLRQSLEAVAKQDAAKARCIPSQDDAIDNLYHQVHQKLVAAIKAEQKAVGQAIHLLQISHQLERIADRTTNICEWVIFAQTGEMKELDVKPVEQTYPAIEQA